ncbi:MAG TPA: SGNH/GDSL hydrolase family protein [Lamprocystis sp. (in: g-proteobacteria)]|nr:SGNH/GDSL hydrolase family protein [Lamprocystis sp. (in: g-proteobacteria)]
MLKTIARNASVLLLLSLAPWCVWAYPYSQIFVLGDSLSDNGNAAIATLATGGTLAAPPFDPVPSAPYAISGRVTNGPVWVEYLAKDLGNTLTPSLAGGTDFAFGGARIIQGATPIPALQTQYAQLLNAVPALPTNALYVVWGGSNDTRDALVAQNPSLLDTAVDGLESIIRGLAAAGATNFLVPNVPDLGLTPEARDGGAALQFAATTFSALFNSELKAAIGDILTDLSGLTIDTLDVFGLLQEVVGPPLTMGFTDATNPCLTFNTSGPGAYCSDPGTRFFWDAIHPTTAGHAAIAAAALQLIPEPATLALLGLIVLVGLGRRAR